MPKNEILIQGVIGKDVTSQGIREQLEDADRGQPLTVRIHSEGGSVFEGFAIYQAFQQYDGPKKAVVESLAGSIASYIAIAFDDVEIAGNGYFMIHNPRVAVEDDDEGLAASSEFVGKLKASMIEAYAEKTGKPHDEIAALMKAETWINAREAVSMGLASSITQNKVRPIAGAPVDRMPYRVVASVYGATGGGDNRDTEQEQSMSEPQTPVAASINDIEKAFPKAKAEFILKCVRQQMPMASVAAAAAEEMMDENARLTAEVEDLKAKLTAMEEEAANATAEGEPEVEEEPAAKVTARVGHSPVARVTGGKTITATAQWNKAITDNIAAGMPKAKAVSKANKDNPGLREQMLAEVN